MPDTPMTDARLDEIETRLRKATPGEWYIDADGDLGKHTLASTHSGYTLIGAFDVGEPDNDEPNADTVLVEHATSDMRDLIVEVRRARAAEAELRADLMAADEATNEALLHNDQNCEVVKERDRLLAENAALRAELEAGGGFFLTLPYEATAARSTCGMPCPQHEHACARSPQHGPPCRDVKQKGTETCSWGDAP